MKRFPFYRQINQVDCGATCLRMIAKYYGRNISIQKLHEFTETTRQGVSLEFLSIAAEKIGFRTLGVKIDANKFIEEAPLPAIIMWNSNHFVVAYKVTKNYVHIADPGFGLLKYNKQEFVEHWIGNNANEFTNEGLALLFEPTNKFYKPEEDDIREKDDYGFRYIFSYLLRYKKFLLQLLAGIVATSIISFIFPFLTQSIVDIGIKNQDLNFVFLILLAQIFLFLGKACIDIIKSWLILHVSTRINISLVSDFFIKLMKLPISFFDTKMTGDLLQKTGDYKGIESFLTTSTINILISFLNLFIFGFVLAYYSWEIFGIFFVGSVLHLGWVFLFYKKRRVLSLRFHNLEGLEKTKVLELFNAMQEIKLYNVERLKRWGWEYIKAQSFKIKSKILSLENTQNVGASLINELKNILITFLAAKLVIEGEITLGMMLSVSYIIGQLNLPISSIVEFTHSLQDTLIRLERVSDIHNRDDEEKEDNATKLDFIDMDKDIEIKDLTFKYTGQKDPVLKNINLSIPSNKVTAIVGASGSGKTTLMKLLLKFYSPTSGRISLEGQDFENISAEAWRERCGVVMQEGYLFNDTIAGNITMKQNNIDITKLRNAANVANIKGFIERLPQTYNTKIGNEGVGLSGGEKQRILISRAIYKDPKLIFFDEATSALDAKNEKDIVENLNAFFNNKTVLIIAHRLSTVKNADQIIVLDEGEIVEIGTHKELIEKKSFYYKLIKNQLELGT